MNIPRNSMGRPSNYFTPFDLHYAQQDQRSKTSQCIKNTQKTSIPNPREHLGREREEIVKGRYPDPLGEVSEEKGRPERGLRRPEQRRMAAVAAV
jgi:hypothetical protein